MPHQRKCPMLRVIDRTPQVCPEIALRPSPKLRPDCTKIDLFQRARPGQIATLAPEKADLPPCGW